MFPVPTNPPHPYVPNFMFFPTPSLFPYSKNKTKNENQIKFSKTRQDKTKQKPIKIKQKIPSQKIPNPMDSVLC